MKMKTERRLGIGVNLVGTWRKRKEEINVLKQSGVTTGEQQYKEE